MAEIYISEFSSLNFRHDWAYGFQMPAHYLQQFLPSDIIRVQAAVPLAGTFRPEFRIVDLADGTSFAPQIRQYSSGTYLVCDITPGRVLEAGSYRFEITDGNRVIHYSEFGVCDSLPGTVLLTATHYRNEFDAIFQDGQVFGLRMAAFFPQSENQFPAETEDFRDQRYSIRQLSSTPYETLTLAIGGQEGVPNWVARKINMYFSLSDTWVDGAKYSRSDGSTPQIEVINALYPMFRYKMTVEKENTFSLHTDGSDWNTVENS